jgi:hypothetical protein
MKAYVIFCTIMLLRAIKEHFQTLPKDFPLYYCRIFPHPKGMHIYIHKARTLVHVDIIHTQFMNVFIIYKHT